MHVDDRLSDVKLVELALSRGGLQTKVVPCLTGKLAIRLLVNDIRSREALPDFILLDLNLPDMSGFEVARLLKSHEATRHIPIVVYTTSDSIADLERAYALGINSYVVKPSTFEELKNTLHKVFNYWCNTNRRLA